MKIIAHANLSSSAAASSFFARWCDHATWGEWSPDTDWVRVEGPVVRGARGVLKPVKGPKVRFEISALETDTEYTDTSLLPGARLVFQHLVRSTTTGSDLEVHVSLTGPLSALWARILSPNFATSVPADLRRLVDLVEGAQGA